MGASLVRQNVCIQKNTHVIVQSALGTELFFSLCFFSICIELVFRSIFQLSFISMSNGEKSEQTGTTVIRFLVEEMNI